MGKAEILKSIKENKPDLLPLPEIDVTNFIENINLLAAFKEKVVGVGGSVIDLSSKSEIDGSLRLKYPNAAKIIDCSQETSLGSVLISEIKEPHKLEDVDLAIIKGEFGVAENGAVWISETQFPIRVLPFIANDLVIVLDKTAICQHLH
ncbi:L-lactate dehydrogenase complex protein LldG, partial [Lutibacter agarilyticus]